MINFKNSGIGLFIKKLQKKNWDSLTTKTCEIYSRERLKIAYANLSHTISPLQLTSIQSKYEQGKFAQYAQSCAWSTWQTYATAGMKLKYEPVQVLTLLNQIKMTKQANRQSCTFLM